MGAEAKVRRLGGGKEWELEVWKGGCPLGGDYRDVAGAEAQWGRKEAQQKGRE